MFLQKIINLDKEFYTCDYIRAHTQERITDINILVKKIEKIKLNIEGDINVDDFLMFINEMAEEKFGSQRNNHNYMHTFLEEKKNSYQRIKYDELENLMSRGKLSYANNLSPKNIMSNYYLSNKIEDELFVTKLETAFRKFARSERVCLTMEDKYKNIGKINIIDPHNQKNTKRILRLKFNDEKLYDEEVIDIKNYFVLQLTRREFFLYDILKKCINGKKLDSLDLLDYMICKYIYNKSLKENFSNWQEYIGNKNISIYQIQYRKSTLGINYKEVINNSEDYNKKNSVLSNMAITEVHTFIVSELINKTKLKHLNKTLIINGIKKFSKKDIEKTKKIIVTLGSNSKLCYLMTIDIDSELFEKINFVIHHFWDKCMIHSVLLNLLLKKDSELNNFEYFKKTKISKEILDRAKFMRFMFDLSENYEKEIKKK